MICGRRESWVVHSNADLTRFDSSGKVESWETEERGDGENGNFQSWRCRKLTKPARSGRSRSQTKLENEKKGRGSVLFLVKILEKKNQIIMNYYVMNVLNESVMPT